MFVCGGDNGIDLLFLPEDNLLKINDKWLDFDSIHVECPCQLFRPGSCGNQFKRILLWSHCRGALSLSSGRDLEGCERMWTSDHWSKTLSLLWSQEEAPTNAPNITITQTSREGELVVSWCDGQSEYFSKIHGSNFMYQVTLHHEDCPELLKLLHTKGKPSWISTYLSK